MGLKLPKKALVTGGAGFLGSHLCRRLLADGYEVTAVDNLFTGSKKNIADLLGERRFSFVQHDIELPYLISFTKLARDKKVKLSYHRDIRDLIKDVYKHV